MEPVPESERMEELRPSPVHSVRLAHDHGIGGKSSSISSSNNNDNNNNNKVTVAMLQLEPITKPPTQRRSTDPSPSSPVSPSWASGSVPYRPRTTSPLSGSSAHSRSCSAAGRPAMPMSRTQSLPGLGAAIRVLYSPQLRLASPSGSPRRVRTPRKPADDVFPAPSPVRASVHDAEPRPRSAASERSSSPIQVGSTPGSMARHRRPPSPLRGVTLPNASYLAFLPSTPNSSSSVSPMRTSDAVAGIHGGTLSSVPSTPTSTRSRSPSISSLETIPDSPDAEEAALEAERLARLQAMAEAADGLDSSDAKARNASDSPARGHTMSFDSRDKRKRGSVCGAERRGDIDLETIWED